MPTAGPAATPNLTVVDGTLFFTANDGTHGRELWKSDGTRGGHGPGQGHQPGRAYCRQHPSSLTAMGGQLFFSANDGTHGAGAVEVGWHQGGHGPGQEHRPGRAYYPGSYPSP